MAGVSAGIQPLGMARSVWGSCGRGQESGLGVIPVAFSCGWPRGKQVAAPPGRAHPVGAGPVGRVLNSAAGWLRFRPDDATGEVSPERLSPSAAAAVPGAGRHGGAGGGSPVGIRVAGGGVDRGGCDREAARRAAPAVARVHHPVAPAPAAALGPGLRAAGARPPRCPAERARARSRIPAAAGLLGGADTGTHGVLRAPDGQRGRRLRRPAARLAGAPRCSGRSSRRHAPPACS